MLSSWESKGLFRGIGPNPAVCKMDRWRKNIPKYPKHTKKIKPQNCKNCSSLSLFTYLLFKLCGLTVGKMQFSGQHPLLRAADSDFYLLSLPRWPHKSCIPFLHSCMPSAEMWLHAKMQTSLWLSLLRNWTSGLRSLHSQEGSKFSLLLCELNNSMAT